MSRAIPASIAPQLAAGSATLARCLTMKLRDGTVLGMSDHDAPLTCSLPGLADPVLQRPGAGILVGDIEISLTLDSGNSEITAPLSAYVGRAQVVGRRFNQAIVWVFDLDWATASPEPLPIMKGTVADARIDEGVAVFELRDNNDFWNITIGSVLTPRCRADFGDAQCGKVREEVAAIVTSTTSSMVFRTNLAGNPSYGDDHFRFGDCQFVSGGLAGVWPLEVVAYTAATGEVELLVPLPDDPAPGDHLLLHNGCSKLKYDPVVPSCWGYQNVLRFRGFDQVPGSDTYIKVAAPGGG